MFIHLSHYTNTLPGIEWWQPDDTSPYLLRCYGFRLPAPVCIDNDFALNHVKAGEPLTLSISRDKTQSPNAITIQMRENKKTTMEEYQDIPIFTDPSRPHLSVAEFTPSATLAPGGYSIMIKDAGLPLLLWVDAPSANWTLTAPTLRQLEKSQREAQRNSQPSVSSPSRYPKGSAARAVVASLPGVGAIVIVILGAVGAVIWAYPKQLRKLIQWSGKTPSRRDEAQYARFDSFDDEDIIEMN
ncbi:hypothetical protein BSLG_001250 [Batrachochytrium salamandrivorans]|nr:hypothetical protein BSLG_001250 [Batrachochytrium salamandrivorans]